MPICKGGEEMYIWLKRYIRQFGKDFPLSKVIDRTEYEIVRIIQSCCASGKEYDGGEDDDVPKVGEAVVGKSVLQEES